MEIAVIRFGAGWSVVHATGRTGGFNSSAEALAAAERLAEDATAQGHEVRVLFQAFNGRLTCLRPQGERPPPPGG